MYLLGIDFETSGTDPQKDRILEVGAVLFDWNRRVPVRMLSELVDPALEVEMEGFMVPAEIEEITGISTNLLFEFGACESDVLRNLVGMAELADYKVAHFGNQFDFKFLGAALHRNGISFPELHGLDTSIDIKYPAKITTRNLRYLAAENGFLNPFSHRAIFDVLTMFKVMEGYDLDAIIARSKEPTVYLQGLVSFDEKEKVKDRGYRWYGPTKTWWKTFKESEAQIEEAECGFRTVRLERAPE